MQDITLTLDDNQLSIIQSYNNILVSPEIDFTTWLQSQIDNRLLFLYRDYIKNKKIETATQMVDFDIVNKMQQIIDVVKLDKTAEYTLSVKSVGIDQPVEIPITP